MQKTQACRETADGHFEHFLEGAERIVYKEYYIFFCCHKNHILDYLENRSFFQHCTKMFVPRSRICFILLDTITFKILKKLAVSSLCIRKACLFL